MSGWRRWSVDTIGRAAVESCHRADWSPARIEPPPGSAALLGGVSRRGSFATREPRFTLKERRRVMTAIL